MKSEIKIKIKIKNFVLKFKYPRQRNFSELNYIISILQNEYMKLIIVYYKRVEKVICL